ncbi:30S ribosomal protein S20 [Patescibacteria group bacterium]|nr:30S ribosomal protein S20 [Patescibacteria group bacterium]
MPNTKSAKKAVRSSSKKKARNFFWKGRIKRSAKTLARVLVETDVEGKVLNEQLSGLQKVLDKASKNKIISKNKANRLKSRYAQKVKSNLTKAAKTQKSTKNLAEE